MNIAIIGYGKMGKEIEKIAKEKGINIVSIIDPQGDESTFKEITKKSLDGADVAIDFTHPDSAIKNIKKVSDLGVNMVVGTTGWYDKMDEVKNIAEKSGIGLIWASNFSIGVNVFFKIIENASKIINNIKEYDILCHEYHHRNKADSPSGTAKSIGEILLENIERKKKLIYDKLDRKISPEEIQFSSTRGGAIPGTHVVSFDSDADTIELKHTARNRSGFALGAVMAAEWIKGKKGFFAIQDMMKDVIGGA